MRLKATTLKEAEDIATGLNYESAHGDGHGVDTCESCGEDVFVIEGHSYDATGTYGYCLNPDCGYELTEEQADEEALTRRIEREP